jgi:hypothetical protein
VKPFVLDANVFIEAHRRYYPFDICPGFWKALIVQHEAKRVFSIDRVEKEIAEGKDRLTVWARESAPQGFFKKTADQAVIAGYSKMVTWVQNEPQYDEEAKATFASVADDWLVAYAKKNGHVVVTEETYSSRAKRTVPIPNVCQQFSVQYMNTFEMLRVLGIKLVLGKRGK